MNKFIITLSIFVFPILAVLILIEVLLSNNTNSYYYLKKKVLIEHMDSCEVLVLGSSSENSGINPAFFDSKGINMAFVGGTSIDVFNLLVLNYVDKMPLLKKVIIPISVFSFYANEERREIKFRKLLLNKYFKLYNKSGISFSRLMVLNLGLKRSLITLFNKELNHVDQFGFDHLQGSLPECLNDNFGKKRAIEHTGGNIEDIKWNVFKKNHKLFVETIIFLNKRNIKLYLITGPTHESYYNNINKKILEIIFDEINILTAKYKIIYYNYLKDSRFVDSDFYNCDHLNVVGAEKFSKILNNDVINDESRKVLDNGTSP